MEKDVAGNKCAAKQEVRSDLQTLGRSDATGRWSLLICSTVMQYTAQKLWHKLDLTPSQQEWVKAQKEREHPGILSLIQMVLEQNGRRSTGRMRRTVGRAQCQYRLLRQTRMP
jgi:hypothetical protein